MKWTLFFLVLGVMLSSANALTDIQQWLDAAVKGDVPRLTRYFEEDATILNAYDPVTGRTAAIEAALNGQTKAIEALLGWGADVKIPQEVKTGMSAFDIAVQNGHVSIVKLLLEVVNPNEETIKDGFRPIHRAAQETSQNHLEILRVILETGKVGANDHSRENLTPMGYVLRPLKPNRFRPAQKLPESELALKREMVRLLLEHGSNTHELGDDEIMTLGLAFREIEEYKKRPKAKRLAPDFRSYHSPSERMLEAVQREDWEWVEHEIKVNGADVNAKQRNSKQTALMTACLKGDLKTLKKLVELGADPTIGEQAGYTPIHGSGYQGHAEIAKYLVEELKMDPNDLHKDGYRPIHRACWGKQPRHTEFVRYLLSSGLVDPDSPTATGLTPLQVLASHEMYRNPHTAKVLAQYGADVSKLTEKEIEDLQLVSDDDFQTCPSFVQKSTKK